VEENRSMDGVGSIRRVTYNNQSVARFQLTALSDLEHSITFDLIDTTPSISLMSVSHTIRLRPVTYVPDEPPKQLQAVKLKRCFLEWVSDHSKDASAQLLQESHTIHLDHFGWIEATVGRTAKIINGNEAALSIQNELKKEVNAIKQNGGNPTLAVILVGERPDSQTYVRHKTKACEAVGLSSRQIDLKASVTEDELLAIVGGLNNDAKVHGILVQLPLPGHIRAENVINRISPSKDVDGLTTHNAGALAKLGVKARLVPCTPLGCLHLLDKHSVTIEGARAVVIGRSDLVGKPMAQLLLSRNATVTVCHSKTANLSELLGSADIVIAAIGKAEFVRGEWLKPGCVVIDVGMNDVKDETKKRGYRMTGDVHFSSASKVARAITPVPGGVGPMTVAMLLSNTIAAFKIQEAESAKVPAKK